MSQGSACPVHMTGAAARRTCRWGPSGGPHVHHHPRRSAAAGTRAAAGGAWPAARPVKASRPPPHPTPTLRLHLAAPDAPLTAGLRSTACRTIIGTCAGLFVCFVGRVRWYSGHCGGPQIARNVVGRYASRDGDASAAATTNDSAAVSPTGSQDSVGSASPVDSAEWAGDGGGGSDDLQEAPLTPWLKAALEGIAAEASTVRAPDGALALDTYPSMQTGIDRTPDKLPTELADSRLTCKGLLSKRL